MKGLETAKLTNSRDRPTAFFAVEAVMLLFHEGNHKRDQGNNPSLDFNPGAT